MSTSVKMDLAAMAALLAAALACSGCLEGGGDCFAPDFHGGFGGGEAVAPPSQVTASDGVYSDKVLVSWTPPAKGAHYEVWRNTSESADGATCIARSVGGTTYADTKATPDTQYYYWVRVRSSGGSSQGGPWDVGYRAARPTVQFASAASSVDEGGGVVSLLVTLSSAVLPAPSVNYAVKGGTATNGQDYTLAKGKVTFGPGETSKAIVVTIAEDLLDEPDETVVVVLSSPKNASLGVLTEHTLTLLDNDPAPVLKAKVSFPVPSKVSYKSADYGSPPELEVSPDAPLDFGAVAVGEVGELREACEVRNAGEGVLAIGVSVPPPFYLVLDDGLPGNEWAFDLGPGESRKLTLLLVPLEPEPSTGTVSFTSNAVTESLFLSGQGVLPGEH